MFTLLRVLILNYNLLLPSNSYAAKPQTLRVVKWKEKGRRLHPWLLWWSLNHGCLSYAEALLLVPPPKRNVVFTSHDIWKVNRLNHSFEKEEIRFFFMVFLQYLMPPPLSVVFQDTGHIGRRQCESSCRCPRKDKHSALFGPSEEQGEHQSSAVAKRDHSPGLLCVQTQQGRRGFWVTQRLGIPKWTCLDCACSRGVWHGSNQQCVNSSYPPGLIAKRTLC